MGAALAAAFGSSLLMSTVVLAQSSEGSIYGQVKPGTAVTAINIETGQSRQIQAESSGAFNFTRLAPGRYRVTAGGVTREVSVDIGSGSPVDFGAQQILVTGTRTLRSIDFNSAESNTVLTQEQIRALPLVRDVNSVAQLAPGVVKGDKDLGAGGLPSIGGASVAENGYYINGFDVTNIRNFLSYANLPFDAIGQQQIKSGGYGAEYGRSLGGVVSLVTKRGTNEWKGGGALYLEPDSLRSRGKDVRNLDITTSTRYSVYDSYDKTSRTSVNLYGGGPIIKDKLFVFGLIEAQRDVEDRPGSGTSTQTVKGRPNGLLKLDWAITNSHLLELTAISNKKREQIKDYKSIQVNAQGQPVLDANGQPIDIYGTSNYVGPSTSSTIESGGSVVIGKYTGYLTDNFTVSAVVGKVNEASRKTTGARVADLSCPVVLETNLNEIGCWIKPFPGPAVRDQKAPDDKDVRTSARVDLEYTLGAHTIRGGIDSQSFKSSEAGTSTYSGGYYYRYFVSANGTVNGVPNAVAPGAQFVRRRESTSTSGVFEVANTAFYIEDSWKVNKDILLYGGLRSESFDNKNGDGVSFVKADNLIAPRLGFSWDVGGKASTKVFATAGRYYIPVASNTNIRMTRGELFEQRFYSFNGRDPKTQGPLAIGPEIGVPQIVSDGKLPNPATVADTKLKPMNQDEFIFGGQHAIAKGWTLGAKVISRKINDGMDDFCGHGALDRWAAASGYTNFDSGSAAPCVLINPGRDVNIQADIKGDGKYVPVTIPAKFFGLQQYSRTYQALELTLDKPFDGRWGFNASYTWSKSKGTAEGYVSSTINQEDAGVTQDFDFGSLTDGANGYLPNDRRHVFKLYGNYQISQDFRLGANLTLASGRPRSCVGFVPPTVPDFADASNYTTASSYYCLNEKTNVSQLVQRGSVGRLPWTYTVDLSFAYTPKFGAGALTLQADVFNILNAQKVTEINEVRDFSRADSLSTVVGNKDNILSKNYGQSTGYQTPRSVRLTARYEF
jgi:hypothetical protein